MIRASMFAAALALTACATTPDSDGEFTSPDGSGDTAAGPSAARIVTEVTSIDGATVRFLDDSEPGAPPAIAVEIGNDLATPILDDLLGQEPSPLELYLAIAPAAKAPPAALVAHHARLAAEMPEFSTTPRALVATSSAESSGAYDCADHDQWEDDFDTWVPNFLGGGQHVDTANQDGTRTGYVGRPTRFYFDVCRGISNSPNGATFVGAQRRPNAGSPWASASTLDNALDLQQRRWRYSRINLTCTDPGPEYRLYTVIGNPYRRAARWADPWECEFGG
jgi:hypothetical protein